MLVGEIRGSKRMVIVMNSSSKFVVVLTTVDKRESAERIAEELVQRRLAACVQVEGPIKSFYRWEGKIESADEFRIVIKTSSDNESEAFALIRNLHDYDTPQIISLPVSGGSEDYLSWVDSELNQAD